MTEFPSAPRPKPARRMGKFSAMRLNKKLNRLSFAAVDCLEELLKDSEVKPADRISAAKLTFDIVRQQNVRPDYEDEGVVRVVFEGIPPEHAG